MRSYIFTDLERQLLRKLLNGDLSMTDHEASATLSRIRTFRDLADDIDLYVRIRCLLAESSTA
jgi:hypothetical protein